MTNGQITQDQYNNIEAAFEQYFLTNGKFTNEQVLDAVVFPLSQSNGPITKIVANAAIANVVTNGQVGAMDVAIIKVNVDYSLPTIRLGDSETVQVGEPLVVIGYPGIVSQAQSSGNSLESLEPTITQGTVSALKPAQTSQGQITFIQTDASIHHGNSGGPVIDAQGNVIGIATLGTGNPVGGGELSNVNFLIPINVAKIFMSQVNVQNTRGPIDTYWAQGLNYYWNQHYSLAIQQFQEVQTLYPGSPYADRYIKLSQEAIANGEDVPAVAIGGFVIDNLYIYGIVGVVVAAVVVLVFLRRRESRITHRPKQATLSQQFVEVPTSCVKCGAELSPGSEFCSQCGTKQTG